LYGERADEPAIAAELASVDIAMFDDRLGQKVRNARLDALQADRGVPYRYRLEYKLDLEQSRIGLRQDESVTRVDYRLTADFQMIDLATEEVVQTGTAFASTGYDVVQSDFATLSAEKNAEDRTAKMLALDIRERLALYFRN